MSSAAQESSPNAVSGEGAVESITLPAVRVELREGEGRGKTESYCNICRSVDYITMQPKFSRAQWSATVTKMVNAFGAPIPQDDAGRIIQYPTICYGAGN